MKKLLLTLCCLTCLLLCGRAQDVDVAKLKNELKYNLPDTERLQKLYQLGEQYFVVNIDTSWQFALQADTLAGKLENKKWRIKTYNLLAEIQGKFGHVEQELEYSLKALAIAEKAADTMLIIAGNAAVGSLYGNKLTNYSRAIAYSETGLKLARAIKNDSLVIEQLGQLSDFHFNTRNFDKALQIFNELLAMAIKQKKPRKIAAYQCGLGDIYRAKGENEKCIECYKLGLDSLKKLCNTDVSVYSDLAIQYNNNALAFIELGRYKEAIETIENGISAFKFVNMQYGVVLCYKRLVSVYSKMNNWQLARKYNNECLDFFALNQLANEHMSCLKDAAEISYHLADYKTAYSQLDSFMNLKATIMNADSRNKLSEIEAALASANKQKEIDLINKEREHQKIIRNLFIVGFVLVLAFVVVLFRSIQQKKKDNQLLEDKNAIIALQKKTVEEKNIAITDSIVYALRIQTAILPNDLSIKNQLPESFILYKPKDIVAGDFYWMEVVGDIVLFAACDCTGHGVPGAMVSVICHNALNRAVLEFGLLTPADILGKTAEIVAHSFSKGNDEIQDGMDISLCAYNKKTNSLSWAGAYNPLWLINSNGLSEIKGDRQSVGKTEQPRTYTHHEMTLQKGDQIYIFTDGFADQFGGAEGKKLQKKRFRELIESIHTSPMSSQQTQLDNFITQYKNNHEQTDDILVMGVRV